METKPHGHGDVHMLLHMHGLAKKWAEQAQRNRCPPPAPSALNPSNGPGPAVRDFLPGHESTHVPHLCGLTGLLRGPILSLPPSFPPECLTLTLTLTLALTWLRPDAKP